MHTHPAGRFDPYEERARFYVQNLARIGKIINELGELPPEPMECGAVAAAALARIAFLADASLEDARRLDTAEDADE